MKAATKAVDNERIEMTFVWRCKCGNMNFNHTTWCASCSENRPAPSEKGPQKGKK